MSSLPLPQRIQSGSTPPVFRRLLPKRIAERMRIFRQPRDRLLNRLRHGRRRRIRILVRIQLDERAVLRLLARRVAGDRFDFGAEEGHFLLIYRVDAG